MNVKKIIIIAVAILVLAAIGITVGVLIMRNRYEVTYDLAGGQMPEEKTYVWYNKYYELPNPTKAGYAFAGWYCDGEYIESAGVWAFEENKVLTATWELRDSNGFVFESTEGGYVVIGYKGVAKSEIAVPLSYGEVTVVGIADGAFRGLDNYINGEKVTRVTFYVPNTITSIGENTFYSEKMRVIRYDYVNEDGMYVLNGTDGNEGYVLSGYSGPVSDRVVIPQGCVSILSGAFDVLKAKAEESGNMVIFIPTTVLTFEEGALCSDKMMVKYYDSVDENKIVYLESENGVTVSGYCGSYDDDITIPVTVNDKPVTAIDSYAFYNGAKKINQSASTFFRIMFSENVVSIGESAFGNCGGIKLALYYVNDKGDNREVIESSRLYDWVLKTEIGNGNGEICDVICQIRPAFGWSVYSNASIYIRLDTNGGVVQKDGKYIDAIEIKNRSSYSLPIPTKDGYTFDGWYADGVLVANEGARWGYPKFMTLVAHWVEE